MKQLLTSLIFLLPLSLLGRGFDEITEEVISRNPSLAADSKAALAADFERIAANRLEATEVEFGYKWPGRSDSETKLDFGVSQSFDWPGVYGARRRALERSREAATKRAASTARQLRLEVSSLLCEIVDANSRIRMLGEVVNNLDSLHRSMDSLLESGYITELDHRKVAIEEITVKQQLAEVKAARTQALAALSQLNGGELPAGAAELNDYPTQPLLPLERYISGGNSSEAEALMAEADLSEADAKAENLGLLPGFSLGYALAREEGILFQGFSVGLRLPSYSAKPAAQAARFEAEALRLRASQADADRRMALTAAHSEALALEDLLREYDHALGSDHPRLLRRALDAGQITYTEYFNDLNLYLNAGTERLSRLLRYHTLLRSLTLF